MSDKSCPINQCKRTNMYMDSQGIMRANKDLVKNYIPTPLPTLVGKPERITALDVRIAADEAELTPSEKVYTITYMLTMVQELLQLKLKLKVLL